MLPEIWNKCLNCCHKNRSRCTVAVFVLLFLFCLISGYFALSIPYVSYRADLYDPQGNRIQSQIDIFNAGYGGTLEGGFVGYFNNGQKEINVTAKAYPGYRFLSWSDGNQSETRTDAPKRDFSVSARFDMDLESVPTALVTTQNYYALSDVNADCSLSFYNARQEFLEQNAGQIRYFGIHHNFKQNSFILTLNEPYDFLEDGSADTQFYFIDCFYDYGKIRDFIALTLYGALNGTNLSMRFVDLYIDGRYEGFYLCCEIPEAVKGTLLTYQSDASDPDIRIEWEEEAYPYLLQDSVNLEETETSLERLYEAIRSGEETSVSQILDIPSAVNAYVMSELFEPARSTTTQYLTLGEDGKFRIWTTGFDLSSGVCNVSAKEEAEVFHLLEWLSQEDWFRSLVLEQWNGVVDSFDFASQVEALLKVDAEAVARGETLWDLYGKLLQDVNMSEDVAALSDREEWAEYFVDWMEKRCSALEEYFSDWTAGS